jgi:hypothetical protein
MSLNTEPKRKAKSADGLLSLFKGDDELCLVVEDVKSEKVVGFALGRS